MSFPTGQATSYGLKDQWVEEKALKHTPLRNWLRRFQQALFAVTWVFEYSTQHSAYVKDWLKVLKEDKKAIFQGFLPSSEGNRVYFRRFFRRKPLNKIRRKSQN